MSKADPAKRLRCISPADGSVFVERELANATQIAAASRRARRAQRDWRETPLVERRAIALRGVERFCAERAARAEEITRQMGRAGSNASQATGGKQ